MMIYNLLCLNHKFPPTSTFNDKQLTEEIEAFVAEFKDCTIATLQNLFRLLRNDFVPKNALLVEMTKMKNRT